MPPSSGTSTDTGFSTHSYVPRRDCSWRESHDGNLRRLSFRSARNDLGHTSTSFSRMHNGKSSLWRSANERIRHAAAGVLFMLQRLGPALKREKSSFSLSTEKLKPG